MSEALMQNALRLRRAGKLNEAADVYSQVLRTEPKHFEALHALGILRYQGGQLEDAERLIGEAIAVRPHWPEANYNRACLLQKLNRLEEAVTFFDRAIALKSDYLEATVNRGTALVNLGRYRDALADFEKATTARPDAPQLWNNRAGVLVRLRRGAEAVSGCDRALAINPGYADAWRNRGTALLLERRYDEALQNFERAGEIDPSNPGAWIGCGHALNELGRREEAILSYGKALAIEPASADALYHRGLAHFRSRWFADAADDFRRTLEVDTDYRCARGALVFSLLSCCDWQEVGKIRTEAIDELHAGKPSLAPFECIAVTLDPADALTSAQVCLKQQYDEPPEPLWNGASYTHDRIRVAYLSANFNDHAVARLMAGVWENHDRSRFEPIAISFSPDNGSPMRARLTQAFERFIDVRDKSDSDSAALLRAMEVDIAVDLMGFTDESRPGILTYRPAPVQVNFLGFPGTIGANHIDYILADRVVIPEGDKRHFSEQVVYLPDAYLPNDSKRAIASRKMTRAEAGLPEAGVIFASFNNNYKFTPAMFELWMRLLKGVKASVLWLPQGNRGAAENLRHEARSRGVAPDRLIFAPYVQSDEDHLARLSLADIFLDTLPYNAHAGACDALWAGVPVLTCAGTTFAARVASSALIAAGLPELLTNTLAAYEALALKLAREPELLAAIKDRLARNRATHPLFDTLRFTRNLESAYSEMWQRAAVGLAPASFSVGDGSR